MKLVRIIQAKYSHYVVAPFDFVDAWIGTNIAVHVDIVALRDGLWVNAAAEAQPDLWRIFKYTKRRAA